MTTPQQNNAALYLRLSRDDGGDVESNSIGNQRTILQRYAHECGFASMQEYIDDGFSGTSFERPSFKRMINDIEKGKINTVLCKDLSRLGRNNALVSYYTELFFPDRGIRFIAVNDCIDSAKGDNEIMPFKSVINEYYARDISKKIRSAFRAQAQKGSYTAPYAPYGYSKDPADKHHLIPNPETAGVVRRIFSLAAKGMGTSAIARTLSGEGIPTPRVHIRALGIPRPETFRADTDWSHTTIKNIVLNHIYLGHMVNLKTTTKSYKNKKQVTLPEEAWIVVKNTHEPLVSEDTFALAQKIIGVKKRGNKYGFKNIFAGLVKCDDCGSGMSLVYCRGNSKKYIGYNCNRYRQHANNYCLNHYITYDNLYAVALASIQEKAAFVKSREDQLLEYARKLASNTAEKNSKKLRPELARMQKRFDELKIIVKKLFEQSALGTIDMEQFAELSAGYKSERESLKSRILEYQSHIPENEESAETAMSFFRLVQKYFEFTMLDAAILNDLIDNIAVSHPEGRGKKRNQTLVVSFRFIKDNLF